MSFRVDLNVFRGPLDLLVYLVRKHEVEVVEVAIAAITEQFLGHLATLEHLDVNAAGDFLELASMLVEIKARELLPAADEVEEPLEDPRRDLVRQLLEYKKFKDAACILEERSRIWQERFPRLADELPELSMADEPIREVELWDLVSALGRIMREQPEARRASILYDETPIETYMARIRERLRSGGELALGDLFEPDMHKSSIVGLFLAILELVRHHSVHAEQQGLFGEILIRAETGADSAIA